MDEQNVHQLWGLSPAINLHELMLDTCGVQRVLLVRSQPSPARLRSLHTDTHRKRGSHLNHCCCDVQVAPYDPRHLVQTICHAHRHTHDRPIELHVYEDNAAALFRHVALIAVLLDEALPAATRMQRFLEIFGNALLREDTADYLAARCRDIEGVLERMMAGHASDTVLGRLFNIRSLSFEARDGLMTAATGARRGREYDMAKAWDARCRSWYADRYDFRRNAVRARCWQATTRANVAVLVGLRRAVRQPAGARAPSVPTLLHSA